MVDATVRRYVEEQQHAGAIWLVARNGRIVDFKAHGFRDLEQKLPMEKDTICRIYSMSKIVTSVGALILLEDGKLRLEDPVNKFIPSFRESKVFAGGTADAPELVNSKGAVTIKHLLTHTSGLIYDFSGDDALVQIYRKARIWEKGSLRSFAETVGKLPLKHQPGESFTYGLNTDVLGAVIEAAAGMPFERFLEERIFKPLDMDDTSFSAAEGKQQRVAKIYRQGEGGKLVEERGNLDAYLPGETAIPSGGAGLFSTAGDYVRFAQMLLNGGTLEGKRVLGRKTVEFMTTNHLTAQPGGAIPFNPAMGFGLGVEMRIDHGRAQYLGSIGQFGWYGAATTYCQIDPQEKIVAILFTQHFPFNQHGIFASFANSYYQALK